MTQIAKLNNALSANQIRPVSNEVAQVRQHINIIQQALRTVMKKNVHFGVIPGCQKPSLYKAGAEVIMALFKLSSDPEVTNLSENGEIRYLVKVSIKAPDGHFVGSGIGECSSCEEKYMWRGSLCDEEFETFPETARRVKFKKWNQKVSQVKQVRTNPSDVANTILKMAKKRAMIDAVLTATGASDIFSQDIEDLPEEVVKEVVPTVEAHYEAEAEITQEAQEPAKTKQSFVSTCECGAGITEKVAKFSESKYGKHLCFNCQKNA